MKISAVCVGIDRYEDFRTLSFCGADAESLSEVLRELYSVSEVTSIANSSAMKDGPSADDVRKSLSLIRSANLSASDIAVFFFAGHGYSASGRDFLVAGDTKRHNDASAIPVDDVTAALRSSGAGTSLIILDACRTLDDRSDSEFGAATAELARRQGVIVFFGCSPREVCQELTIFRHGIFTYALIESLRSQRPATALSIDRAVSNMLRGICAEYNLSNQNPYTVVEPIQKASLDLISGDVVPLHTGRKGRCVIIAGLPNSGKTVAGQYIARSRGYIHVEMSTYAWKRYFFDQADQQGMSIQDYMEQVVWTNRNMDVIAKDLLEGLSGSENIVICGPRTPEEIETLRAKQWDVELIFLHSDTRTRHNRYLLGLNKSDRWGSSYPDVVGRDYRELGWGLARVPSLSGSRYLINEGDLTAFERAIDHRLGSRDLRRQREE